MKWESLRTAFWQAHSVGIVRTDHLGDMVLTLPMVAALRRLRADVHVLLFAHPRVYALLQGQPGMTAVFVQDRTTLRQQLRKWKPEILFFPRPDFREVAVAWWTGIPYRIGSGYRWYSFLFTHRIYEHRRTAERHEAEYNVRMITLAAGVREMPVSLLPPVVPETARQRVQELIYRCGVTTEGFVLLHPGGRGSAPRWKPESFAQLAERLEVGGIPCVFTGTGEERPIAERIQRFYPRARLLFGVLSTEELIALVAEARVVVANSTGVLHIAAALGKAVVGLYSRLPAHHPRRWGPYTERAIVLVPPPGAPPDAVTAIPVVHVQGAVQQLWKGYGELFSEAASLPGGGRLIERARD